MAEFWFKPKSITNSDSVISRPKKVTAQTRNGLQKIKLKIPKHFMNFSKIFKITRIQQPTGIFLLFLPCIFGIMMSLKTGQKGQFLAEQGLKVFELLIIFFLGSVFMRSAGCVINDILDQKFDAQVKRTQNRALVSKEISKTQALVILVLLLSLSFLLILKLNLAVILASAFSLILVFSYPLMKRITYYPQVFLGLTFNYGIILASLAVNNEITLSIILLYLAAIFWTMLYDTIYAYQDLEDDLKVGVKSMAIKLGQNPRKILQLFNLIFFIIMLIIGWLEEFRAEYFLTILVADLFMNAKIQKCDFDNSNNCLKVFKSSVTFGLIVVLALFLA